MVIQNIQKQKQSKYKIGELKLFHSKPFHAKEILNSEHTSIENEYKTQTFVDINLNLKQFGIHIT